MLPTYVGMMVVDVLDFKHRHCSLLVILAEKPKAGFSAMLPDASFSDASYPNASASDAVKAHNRGLGMIW